MQYCPAKASKILQNEWHCHQGLAFVTQNLSDLLTSSVIPAATN